MHQNRAVILFIIWFCVARGACAAECATPPQRAIDLYPGANGSLLSPDLRWRFIFARPESSNREAIFYIEDHHSSQKWKLGSIERSGRAFWSQDSKRLFLRDEYAADDTKIRVFDVSSPEPKEIKGLNRRMRKAIFAQIPQNKTTLWLYYPQVCFASNDSSTIIAVADAPLVPKKESGSGTPFRVKLTVNLITLEIASTTHPPREQSAE